MGRFLRRSVAVLLLPVLASAGGNCEMRLERRPASEELTRIVPVLGRDGVALVWQEGAAIQLQRMDHDCTVTDGWTLDVYRNEDFLGEVGRSGLEDAAEIGQGVYAVTWILNGSVWVSVVVEPGVPGASAEVRPPVMANNASSFHHRAHARLARGSPANASVAAVTWTSWDEDGDGWGVFATTFSQDGALLTSQQQLNTESRGFQWRPELLWCQGSLWAMWRNGSGTDCDRKLSPGSCDDALMSRDVGDLFAAKRPPAETNLGAKWPLASAMACEAGSASATALWLEDTAKGPRTVRWRPMRPPGVAAVGPAASVAAPWPSVARLRGSAAAEVGDIAVVAGAGIGVLMVVDGEGGVVEQVVQYDNSMGPQVYEPRRMGAGSLAGVAWNVAQDSMPTMVACFVTGSQFGEHPEPLAFSCERRSTLWLAGMEGYEMTFGGAVVTLSALGLMLLACCYLRHCTPPRHAAGGPGARLLARGRMELESPQLRELREQLARIPREVPGQPPCQAGAAQPSEEGAEPAPGDAGNRAGDGAGDGAAAGGGDGAEVGASPAASVPQNECGICQNEVAVRIAMTCGHTACRDCIAGLLNRGQPCHICRAPIVGLLPVYT